MSYTLTLFVYYPKQQQAIFSQYPSNWFPQLIYFGLLNRRWWWLESIEVSRCYGPCFSQRKNNFNFSKKYIWCVQQGAISFYLHNDPKKCVRNFSVSRWTIDFFFALLWFKIRLLFVASAAISQLIVVCDSHHHHGQKQNWSWEPYLKKNNKNFHSNLCQGLGHFHFFFLRF